MTISVTGAASAADAPTVSLTVNGNTSTVTTTASTVGGLLSEQQVRYDNNDTLKPGEGTQVVSGMSVDLTSAVALTVKDDGSQQHHLVEAVTVNQVRNALNLPSGTRLARARLNDQKFERTIIYSPAGRKLSGTERVREGSTAIVHDIRLAYPSDKFRVKHHKVRNHSKLVRKGSIRVYKNGHDGRKRVVWRKVFVDGELTNKNVVKKRWLRHPQRRVVRVGTGPNWIALARCESGNNPNAVNPAGYYGLYQFSVSTWRAVGGRGNPTDYGYWEQTKRAWKLFRSSGRSPWPVCGRFL